MRTITLVAWRRPHYLKQVVDALRCNDTSGYALIVVLDAGYDPECLKIVDSIDFIPKRVITDNLHYGINHANRIAYETALGFSSELNFALEEDTVPTPDCLSLVSWWADTAPKNAILCAMRPGPGKNPYRLFRDTKFNGWGWAAPRAELKKLLASWCDRAPIWDESVLKFAVDEGWAVHGPALSRVRNIGEDGSHHTPETWKKEFEGQTVSESNTRAGFSYFGPTIHTFFEPMECWGPEGVTRNSEMLRLWEQSWQSWGWGTRRLSLKDSVRHPKYDELNVLVAHLPTVNPKEYERLCWLRWLAIAMVGGWFVDYDVLNYGFTPPQADLWEGVWLDGSVWGHDGGACMHGERADYDKLVNHFLNVPPAITEVEGKPHISDMTSRWRIDRTGLVQANLQIEVNQPDWLNYPLIHYPGSRCSLDRVNFMRNARKGWRR